MTGRRSGHAAWMAAVAILGLFGIATSALAHDPGLSTSTLVLGAERATATLRIHEGDLSAPLAGDHPEAILVVRSGDDTIRASKMEQHREGGELVVSLELAVPRAAALEVSVPLLSRLPRGHRHFVEVEDERGARVTSALLVASAPALPIPPAR